MVWAIVFGPFCKYGQVICEPNRSFWCQLVTLRSVWRPKVGGRSYGQGILWVCTHSETRPNGILEGTSPFRAQSKGLQKKTQSLEKQTIRFGEAFQYHKKAETPSEIPWQNKGGPLKWVGELNCNFTFIRNPLPLPWGLFYSVSGPVGPIHDAPTIQWSAELWWYQHAPSPWVQWRLLWYHRMWTKSWRGRKNGWFPVGFPLNGWKTKLCSHMFHRYSLQRVLKTSGKSVYYMWSLNRGPGISPVRTLPGNFLSHLLDPHYLPQYHPNCQLLTYLIWVMGVIAV